MTATRDEVAPVLNGLVAGMFDAVLFDAGGVLVLPDAAVLAPLLAAYGGSVDVELHRRVHYAAMAAKSAEGSVETDWSAYNSVYVREVGVMSDDVDYAAEVLDRTRNAHIWRAPVPGTREALAALAAVSVPMGVVSNASGQIEDALVRAGICQLGSGPHVEMRVIVDSHVVGVAKPDPRIFEYALPAFDGFDRSRIAYVGDSVTMDVESARAAGLHPILIDPFDDHAGADFDRIGAVAELLPLFAC